MPESIVRKGKRVNKLPFDPDWGEDPDVMAVALYYNRKNRTDNDPLRDGSDYVIDDIGNFVVDDDDNYVVV